MKNGIVLTVCALLAVVGTLHNNNNWLQRLVYVSESVWRTHVRFFIVRSHSVAPNNRLN